MQNLGRCPCGDDGRYFHMIEGEQVMSCNKYRVCSPKKVSSLVKEKDMSLEKKGKFWVASANGKVLYRSHVRPHGEQLAHLLISGEPLTIERHTQETFDDKFPDDTKIKAALAAINPDFDEHWTKGGLPVMSYVEGFVGDNTITRRQVSAACPNLVRGK